MRTPEQVREDYELAARAQRLGSDQFIDMLFSDKECKNNKERVKSLANWCIKQVGDWPSTTDSILLEIAYQLAVANDTAKESCKGTPVADGREADDRDDFR